MNKLSENKSYNELIKNIGSVYYEAKSKIISAINVEILDAYWKIGKNIVEFEQKGELKAEYGKKLLVKLSKDLSAKHGKGFSRSNLQYMRLFYIHYPIRQTVSGKLSWSHYVELLSINDDLEREFYQKQAEIENWTVRELKRQKKTGLFHRIALSKDKEKILELAQKGQIVQSEQDLIGKVEYEHIGQMKLYLGYYEKEINDDMDNQPIGIILSEQKDDIMVEYAMLNDTSKLLVSEYQLYLPDKEELKRKVKEIIEE